ncbi:hypothetical protein D9757_010779 [Collybiopsis confluens]|uniref:Fungal-type protein kinase domain-containing protein n=1 Tax=Collybiopsis confluens TaxID=2823264 RepID=A0A8H5M2Q6_9AGAR|nr:hypothetical protein D9757_010779 [Collybiopsis confluens]
MSSTSPRKSGSAYPPRDGTAVRQSSMRARIKSDAGNLLTCSTRDFLDTYASKTQLKPATESALRSLKIVNYLDKDGWVELRQAKREKKGENPTYEFLGPLAKLVTMAAVTADPTLKPQAEARPSPTATSRHSKPGYRFFPDWTSVLVSSSLDVDPKPHRGTTRKDSVDTSDISAIGEFKLGQTKEDICDNEEKLVGAANQLLWNDPCRERVLGFTIEDKRTRFWDFSRCSVTVSEDFDLDKKPEFLVEFLLFITFAEKHEMGFDPTMHRVLVENQTRFVYEVGGKSYLTVGQPLSEEAAYRLVGRATRVWEVVALRRNTSRTTIVEVGGKAFGIGSKKRVLKDVWLYEDALLEKDIQEEILARLNDSDRKTLENHFLTFDKEEVVTFEGKERYTLKSGNAKSADWHNDSYSHHNSGISASRGTRENPKRQEPEHARVTHAHTRRKHVRSVAKEMCLSLYELTNFGDALICWHDIVKCLNLFRKAGFLHRDLSGGNTLFFERRGIISDLEYCKKYRDTSIHDLKTGTPDFMAAEYQANRFFFLPEPAKETKNLFKHKRDWFAVHFVHDLESVYWQYLWFLHNRIPDQRVSRESLDQISDRAKLYFGHNINGNDDRSRIIQEPGSNLELQQYLSPVHSTSYLKLLSLSESLRQEYGRLLQLPPERTDDDDDEVDDDARRQEDRGSKKHIYRLKDSRFNEQIYKEFEGMLEDLLKNEPDDCPVISIEDATARAEETKVVANRLSKKRKRDSKNTTTSEGMGEGVATVGAGASSKKRKRNENLMGNVRSFRSKKYKSSSKALAPREGTMNGGVSGASSKKNTTTSEGMGEGVATVGAGASSKKRKRNENLMGNVRSFRSKKYKSSSKALAPREGTMNGGVSGASSKKR